MNFIDYVEANFDRIVFLLVQHVQAVLIAVAIAAVIGVGIGVATESRPKLRTAALSISGTILTVPSFALFGLMIPLFGLGVLPTILALTVYGVFPILRNTVTGLETVDASVLDAARGMGMGTLERLRTVKIPLAWPVILNGVRTATIMLVAIAAIGAAVNGPGLGELIFRGLARIGGANALEEALSGVVGVVVVALVLDLIFLVIGKLTTPRGLNV